MGATPSLTTRRALLVASAAGVLTAAWPKRSFAQPPTGRRFAIALHGGAGKSPEKMTAEQIKAVEASLSKALAIGEQILKGGGTSLDAVEQVIRFLEDDPHFNAGKGAVFNSAGGHELDASIMDGKTKACGAVAAVQTVKNPISLARLVMTKTRHVLLTSDGAEKFADEMQVERVENKSFDTDKARREWEERKKADAARQANATSATTGRGFEEHYGTVGCVALDTHGDLAAGTSTGGLTNKKYGRVGDSPIVGAGTYADNATCAVSGTGIGEEFIRHAAAYDVSVRLAYLHQPLKEAVSDVLRKSLKPGDGGIIAVGSDGSI
ncbi:MAG TPA: isoaspartyl peptidase/L-asparaginase, partial [Pirellulaceae bacterium]|nr:isoaspartyl peptidase/L-asparaginase [Pirellulaceae bacterium]